MKRILKFLLAFILLIFIAIVAFPFVYKDKINRYIKQEINKSVNAKVDYKDVSLSLLKDFPNLHVSIKDISVEGVQEFDSIRLANIPEFDMSLNFKKLFTDENLEIKKIALIHPDFNILVLKNGKANYDIVKSTENQGENANEKAFDLKINSVKIENLDLNYDDRSLGLAMKIKNLNQKGSGKFTDKKYGYRLDAQMDTLDVIFDGIHYINNAKSNIRSTIDITNDFKTYKLPDLQADINDLDLVANMFFDLKGDDIEMDINYKTQDNSLKKFLSLIPPTYMPDLQGIQTNGTANLKGFVKGTYNDKNYPAYGVDFKVENGYIKYPDLPESIKNINIVTKVDFKGGKNLDNTLIKMPKIHFSIAGNAVDGFLNVSHPMTDPYINTAFNGNIDLNKVNKALKLSKSGIKELSGKLFTDFKLKTSISAIEKEKYENIDASGVFHLDDFKLQSDAVDYPIAIKRANLGISPEYLKLFEFQSQVGKSDFDITGNIENYLQYFLTDKKTLKADFSLYSKKIDLNQFMTDEKGAATDTTTVGYIKIPENLDIKLKGQADEVIYKDMHLKDLEGNLDVKDKKAKLNTVLAKAFDGQMGLSGIYDTSGEKPKSSLKMDMKKVSISEATSGLTTFNYYAPALKKIQGNFFSNMQMDVQLDDQMNPIFSTLDLTGFLETKNIGLNGIDILKKIGDLLKINELKKPSLDQVKAQFEIDKGNLNIKPFDFKLNGMKSEFQGKVSLDRKIDFILRIDIPKNKLGANANQIIENLVGKLSKFGIDAGLPDIIKMKFKIKGDYNQPKIVPVFAGYEGKSVKEVVTEVATQQVNQVIDDTQAKLVAEAKAKADILLKNAQMQADKIVTEAKKVGNKIRQEAQKQADELIKEAGNNPLKKYAAQQAAKKIVQAADKKAKKLETDAQNKANQIMQNAHQKADKLINDAQNKDLEIKNKKH